MKVSLTLTALALTILSGCKALEKHLDVPDMTRIISGEDAIPEFFHDKELAKIYAEFKQDLKKVGLKESDVELRVLRFDQSIKPNKNLSGECQQHRPKNLFFGGKSFNIILISPPHQWASFKNIHPAEGQINLKVLVYHELGHCQLNKPHSNIAGDSRAYTPIMNRSFSAKPKNHIQKYWRTMLDEFLKR